MAPSVLFTGASGYLGGTVLAQVVNNTASPILPRSSYDKIYAMVRTDAQVSAIEQHYSAAGVEPLQLDHKDEAAVKKVLLEKGITVVFYLIDAFGDQGQKAFIKALGSVRKERGREVHFLHVSRFICAGNHHEQCLGRNDGSGLLTKPHYRPQERRCSPRIVARRLIDRCPMMIRTCTRFRGNRRRRLWP